MSKCYSSSSRKDRERRQHVYESTAGVCLKKIHHTNQLSGFSLDTVLDVYAAVTLLDVGKDLI